MIFYRLSPFLRPLLIALSLTGSGKLWALQANEFFQGARSRSYQLIEKLGEGYFGEVWAVRNTQTKEVFATEFFFKEKAENREIVFDIYSRLAQLQDSGQLSHLIRSYGVDNFNSARGDTTRVVRLALGGENLERLERDNFTLIGDLDVHIRIQKVKNAHKLMQAVLRGILELKEAGFNHHDLNPRNILRVGDSYLISDLDELRAHGQKPSLGAFEAQVAPIEYEMKGFRFNDDNLSDIHQLSNTVYKLLFGKYRIDELAETSSNGSVQHLRDSLAASRDFASHDLSTRAELESRFAKLFPDIAKQGLEQQKVVKELFDFLQAGLILDAEERRLKLSELSLMQGFDLIHDREFAAAKSAEEFLRAVAAFNEKAAINPSAQAEQVILRHLEKFRDLKPVPKQWLALKKMLRTSSGMVEVMKKQLPGPKTTAHLIAVLKNGFDGPISYWHSEVQRAIDDEILVPALESGTYVHSLQDSIELRKHASHGSASSAVIRAGLPYARNFSDFLDLVAPQDQLESYGLSEVMSAHIEAGLRLAPSAEDLRRIPTSLLSSESTRMIEAYLELKSPKAASAGDLLGSKCDLWMERFSSLLPRRSKN